MCWGESFCFGWAAGDVKGSCFLWAIMCVWIFRDDFKVTDR